LETDPVKRASMEQALRYMDLQPNAPISAITLDRVFIGSCTNGRIEDLRAAAAVIKGRKVAPSLKQALVVPGSGLVKQQAEAEGLDRVFTAAGFEWREPGCSMCLAMNADQLLPGEHCASTSNRNFEGRQGRAGAPIWSARRWRRRRRWPAISSMCARFRRLDHASDNLVIGNKNYSSWSLRPWLAARHAGIEFDEIRIPLYTPDAAAQIQQLLAIRQGAGLARGRIRGVGFAGDLRISR
jgi:hypothetical protein